MVYTQIFLKILIGEYRMPKAIISNRIYLSDPGTETTKELVKTLTYKIHKNVAAKKFNSIETIKTYKILPNNIISIPQGRVDLIPDGYEIIDKRVSVPTDFPAPLYELFDDQKVVYENVNDTCIINALVGWGKSFTALYLARKFGQKTLIVVHTVALMDQWLDNINMLFGIEVGTIGGGRKVDYDKYPITVATSQTLIKHIDSLSKTFGTIVVDECHHVPSTTFSSIIDKLHAKYRIGLSGTLIRKDGKHILFNDYFGGAVFKPPQSNTMNPMVKLINTGITLLPNAIWVDKITALVNDVEYQKFIAICALTHIELGHCVLVIADRVEFLQNIANLIGDDAILVTGDTSTEDRAEAKRLILNKEKSCIVGSRQIFSEGISIDRLSCVILTTPMNNDSLLEQIIGRVQRKFEGKLTPLVLDMQFNGWDGRKQNMARTGVYLKKGWVIETV